MLTLYDLGIEIMKIRETANELSISGAENAARIVLIAQKCNQLIQSINETAEACSNTPKENQNGQDTLSVELQTDGMTAEEEGEVHGEQNSGPAE